MKKSKPQKGKVVPRFAPPTNLRKAGAHDDKRGKALEELSDEERDLDELKSLGQWAYDEDV